MGFQTTDCHQWQSSGWRVFSSVNYNNVYGRWITTQYLRQIKENSKLNNGGFNKWLEILAGKDLQTKLRKSEKVDFKFSASNGTAKATCHCQLETEAIQRPRICKDAATKYYKIFTLQTKPTKWGNTDRRRFSKTWSIEFTKKPKRGKFTWAPNENIIQNHLNIGLLNVP